MSGSAQITAQVASWDESTYAEFEDGRKLTRATVTQVFTGDLEGDGAVEFLMCYRPDGTASFVGQQRVVGSLGALSGAFVMHATGAFAGAEARWDWSVVPGSGTGDLTGLSGDGTAVAAADMKVAMTLEYDLP